MDTPFSTGDSAADDDLCSSVDGAELVKATWTLFGLRARLVTATQVSTEDPGGSAGLSDGKAGVNPNIPPPQALVVSPPEAAPFTDEDEVRDQLAESIANLIEVRSRIKAGTFRSPREIACLDNELASATELLRLITSLVRRQECAQGQQPHPMRAGPTTS